MFGITPLHFLLSNIFVDMINIFEVFLPQLLRYPNPADPLNGDAAVLLLREPKSYEAKVRDYVLRYATKEAVEEMDNSEDSEYEMSDAEMSDDEEEEPAGQMELSWSSDDSLLSPNIMVPD